MNTKSSVPVHQLDEFLEEAPTSNGPVSNGEVIRPSVLLTFVEVNLQPRLRHYTVLLKQGGTITIEGHRLEWLRSGPTGEADGVYSIVEVNGEKESIIAMFSKTDVVGVFTGQLPSGANGTNGAHPTAS